MPSSRSRSPAPLGAFQPPKSVRHAAISAQNRRHRASRPPGHPCEHKKTTSGKWRKAQRQSATSELRDSANDAKHADAVSRAQTREQDAKMRREVAPKWSGRPLPPVPHLQPPAQRTKGLRGSPGSGWLARFAGRQIGRVVALHVGRGYLGLPGLKSPRVPRRLLRLLHEAAVDPFTAS